MKIKYGYFLMIAFMYYAALFPYESFALSKNCSSGQYAYLSTQCKSCPANCYCPTNGNKQGTGWTGISCSGGNSIKSNTNSALSNGDFDIHLCPYDYPSSNSGSSSAEQCYYKCPSGKKHAGETLYNKSKSCPSGQYRPKGSNDCKACPDDGKSICTGVSSFKPLCDGASSDTGIRKCDTGTMPNSSKTSCESSSVTCEAGKYLPSKSNSCTACKSDSRYYYYCPGGTFSKASSKDQGLKECPAGQRTNSAKTGCVDNKKAVPAGSYLPANSSTPASCKTDKKYYCPGGNYIKSSVNQGIFECPKGTVPNQTKKACTITLSKETMTKCFLENETFDENKYKKCLLGNARYYK